ncbi:protein trichome birefringence-like 31 [Dorcoceras hygrometricum]|uniref:Protein trichome birefringence-like 31 n=1 Tax=Dorcoceras hygrometricum TaxID=472368 RepID=A0A2Z7CV87_9LAMI|nr:protein trichome birefringence-like 31 [Dorcoceras hygrometricum]
METSKVESVVRKQAEAKLNQLERSESAGTMRRPVSRFILLLTNMLAVAIHITVDESVSSRDSYYFSTYQLRAIFNKRAVVYLFQFQSSNVQEIGFDLIPVFPSETDATGFLYLPEIGFDLIPMFPSCACKWMLDMSVLTYPGIAYSNFVLDNGR